MTKSLLIVAVLLGLSACSTAFAQTQTVAIPDPDWATHQHAEEATKYWLWWEKSGPDTNIAEARAEGYKEFTSMKRPKSFMVQSSPAWQQVGGALNGNISGRPTAMGFSKQNSGTCYLATSGGGLWKSTNYGQKWVLVSGSFTTNAAGGVAVDYTDENIVYAGTGDFFPNSSPEISKGDGMFKSTDGGLNWVHIAKTGQVGNAINQVILDPVTPTTVYTTADDGIHQSLDAGTTWKKISGITGIVSMVIDPHNPNRLFAAGSGQIIRSDDAGKTWSADLAGNIGGKGSIVLAISAKNTAVVYASIGGGGTSIGLAKSLDSGATWNIVSNPQVDDDDRNSGYMSDQANYDNACAVSQFNENNVTIGGLDILATANGGASWPFQTHWRNSSGANDYTHADIHVLQYGAGYLWALTDGGVFLSNDNGHTWQSGRNSGLPTLLFCGGDADKDFTFAIGGAQDNGVSKTSIPAGTTFKEKVGGDGGRCFVSQTDGLAAYSTYVYASLQKSPDGGESWSIGPRGDNNVIPNGSGLLSENRYGPFYMYYDVCEADPSYVAVAGTSNVYYSTDGVATLNNISGGKVSGPVSVHVSAADPSTVYAGNASTIYVTTDAGTTWTKSTTNVGTVSDYASDPDSAGHVWVSIAGAGGKHFGVSTDFGKTWQFPAKNLPNLNFQTIARAKNGDLFLGHTLGVMRSIDNGVNWEPLTDGMPHSQVTKLRVRGSSTQYLLATTYGHGMMSLDITDLPRFISDVASQAAPESLAITSVNPNPVISGATATVRYNAAVAGDLQAKLFDDQGREIKMIANEMVSSGSGSFEFSLPQTSGAYWIVLTEAGHSVTRKIMGR